MTRDFDESGLRFHFKPAWAQVAKWDKATPHKRLEQGIPESSAVDFVAGRQSAVLLLEVKSYLKPNTTPPLWGSALAAKIARKVRDTVAGIVGAAQTAGDGLDTSGATWQALVKTLSDPDADVHVVFWWELGEPYVHTENQRKQLFNNLIQLLKPKLRWLTGRVLVCSLDDAPAKLDLEVLSLPTTTKAAKGK